MAARACPRCGSDLPPDARFCPACGLTEELEAEGGTVEKFIGDAPWERALTELDLARVSSDAGTSEETKTWAARAAATFVQLRDTEGAAAARALTGTG